MQPAVLFVDDEQSICSALRRTFKRSEYRVYEANSGSQALDLLRLHPIDVVVSDQRMPGMTGTKFLSIVKHRYPRIGRIMLSGQSDVNDLTEAINEADVYKFLPKPWNDEQLLTTVASAMPANVTHMPVLPLQKESVKAVKPAEIHSVEDAFAQKQIDLEQAIKNDTLEIKQTSLFSLDPQRNKVAYYTIQWPKFTRFEHNGIVNIAQQSGYTNDLFDWYLIHAIDNINQQGNHNTPVVIDLFAETAVRKQNYRSRLSQLMTCQRPIILRIPFSTLKKDYLTDVLMDCYHHKTRLMLSLDKRVLSLSELKGLPIDYLEMCGKFNAINNGLLTEKRLKMISDAQNLSIKTILFGGEATMCQDYATTMGFDFF